MIEEKTALKHSQSGNESSDPRPHPSSSATGQESSKPSVADSADFKRTKYRIIAISFGLGVLMWIVDAAVDSLIFDQAPFWDELILDVLPQELWFRSLIVMCFLGSGITVAKMMERSRQSERELRASERRLKESGWMLQHILDTIPVQVFWKDRNFKFMGCNRCLAEDLGLKDPEEIIGMDDYDLTPREEADAFRADDKKVLETREPMLNYEEPMTVRPGGATSWYRTNKVPLTNSKGDVIGILGTCEDITERKQAEDALRESNAFMREFIDNIPGVVTIKDSHGRMNSR